MPLYFCLFRNNVRMSKEKSVYCKLQSLLAGSNKEIRADKANKAINILIIIITCTILMYYYSY